MPLKNEFAHLVWGADLGLAGTLTVAVLLYADQPVGIDRSTGYIGVVIQGPVPMRNSLGLPVGRKGSGQLYPV